MTGNPTARPGAVLAAILLASATMSGAILVGSTAAQAATTPAAASAFTPIRNVQTGQCIQPRANAESQLVQVACKPDNHAQLWISIPKNNGYHIVNQLSGLCMYLDGPVSSGSPVIQAGCTTVTNEDWSHRKPPAVTRIESKAGHDYTDLCLAPQSFAAGALLRVVTCNTTNVQKWVIGV